MTLPTVGIPPAVQKELSGLLGRLLGPSADVLGELLKEKVRLWFGPPISAVLSSAEHIATEREQTLSPVPPKFLIPFLDRVSLEEDGSPLTEEWAKLLVAAATEYHPRLAKYADILGRLGPDDAKLLRGLWGNTKPEHIRSMRAYLRAYVPGFAERDGRAPTMRLSQLGDFVPASEGQFGPNTFPKMPLGMPPPRPDVSAALAPWELLQAEGLVRFLPSEVPADYGDGKTGFHIGLGIELTSLGFDFVETLERGRLKPLKASATPKVG